MAITVIGLLVLLSSCSLLLDLGRKQYSFQVVYQDKPLESLSVARGAEAELTVSISPVTGIDLTADIATITLTKAPPGVSIDPDPLTLPSGINQRSLKLVVAANASPVTDTTIELQSEKGGVGRRYEFKLSITTF